MNAAKIEGFGGEEKGGDCVERERLWSGMARDNIQRRGYAKMRAIFALL